MFNKIKEFFTGKPAEVVAEVPYKVEVAVVAEPVAPVAPVAEQAVQAVIESIAPAKKAAAKKPAVKKPAVTKPKKPKAPAKPKAVK